MDGGVSLTSRTSLYAVTALGLSMEYLATSDEGIQSQVMITNEHDANGVLLYPDGEPRFQMIYLNGGSATGHGNSLGASGRSRLRTFFARGGGYSGSCAGAFIASISYMSTGIYTPYLHIWPGRTAQPSVPDTYTGHFIPQDSPLLNYYDFGNDHYIAHVYHNYGPYARENPDYPAGTEVLLRYDYPSGEMHQKPSCWAYTADDFSGRLVVIGSHPESVSTGERFDLMKAVLQYVLDRPGAVTVKTDLENGVPWIMDQDTDQNNPEHTKIGDRQLHHFRVVIPEGIATLQIDLDGPEEYDFRLNANYGEAASSAVAEFSSSSSGADHTLTIENPQAGDWYVAVKAENTIYTSGVSWGKLYYGPLEVLNGLPYTLTATWSPTADIAANSITPDRSSLEQNYPNPFNTSTVIPFVLADRTTIHLSVINSRGQLVKHLAAGSWPAGRHALTADFTDLPSGMYYYVLRLSPERTETRKLLLLK